MLGLSRRDVALLAGGTVTGALGLLAAQRLAVLLWAPKGAQAAEPALGERELAREITGLTAAIQNLAQVVTDRHLTLTAPQAPAHTHTRHAPRTAAHRHDDDDEFVLASEVLAGYDEADGGYEEASTVAHLADVSVSHVAEDSLTPTQQLLKVSLLGAFAGLSPAPEFTRKYAEQKKTWSHSLLNSPGGLPHTGLLRAD